MNGPPLVVYASLRGWSPQHFRATLQAYFFPASAAGMLGFWIAGLWVPEVTRYFAMSIVAAVLAVFLGRTINRRLQPETFIRLVHFGLIGIALVLLFQA
jgi:uncharacterized membrane protein YfcA